jgi:hypothetical protein
VLKIATYIVESVSSAVKRGRKHFPVKASLGGNLWLGIENKSCAFGDSTCYDVAYREAFLMAGYRVQMGHIPNERPQLPLVASKLISAIRAGLPSLCAEEYCIIDITSN